MGLCYEMDLESLGAKPHRGYRLVEKKIVIKKASPIGAVLNQLAYVL